MPLTSSHCTEIFIQADSWESRFRSPREISKTRPRRESAGIFCPAALLQGVKVGADTSKFDGTRTLYHSFLMKGWEIFFFCPFFLKFLGFFPAVMPKFRSNREARSTAAADEINLA